MTHARGATYVRKACAYVTRASGELLVFEGPGHEGYQIPKGTVESEESPREAVYREITEESGLGRIGPRAATTTGSPGGSSGSTRPVRTLCSTPAGSAGRPGP